MSGIGLESVWQIGPRITAQVLGLPFTQYRPTSALNPITTPLATLPVWVTADAKLQGVQPFKREKPDERYAAVDPSLVAVGDYLVGAGPDGAQHSFFIADCRPPAAIRLVECYRIVSLSRPVPSTDTPTGYSARQTAGDTKLATGWPASIVQGTKGEANPSALPDEPRAPWVTIMLPAIPGIVLTYSDKATDDEGNSYVFSNVELTGFGYRISAMYVGA